VRQRTDDLLQITLARRFDRLGHGEGDEIKLIISRDTQLIDDGLVILDARSNDDDDVVDLSEDGLT